MEPVTILGIVLLLMVALTFSPIGLGGGVLYVPILYYLLEWDIQQAVMGSLALVFMVALSSSLAHMKTGHAASDVAMAGRMTAIPGAVIGTLLGGLLLDAVGDVGIKILAAVILVFVIERTISRIRGSDYESEEKEFGPLKRKYQSGTAFAGMASGILGIGGGAILVTLNRSLLGMEAHKAAGTSYQIGATIVPVALASHIILSGSASSLIEQIGILPIILVPALAFTSAWFGAKYAIKHLPEKVITIIFLTAVSASLLRYIIDFIGLV